MDRWTEWAKKKTENHIKDAAHYISEGVAPEVALEMVLKNSALSEKHKKTIVAEVMGFPMPQKNKLEANDENW